MSLVIVILVNLTVCILPALVLADADATEYDWLIHSPTAKTQVLENVCWSDGLCGIEMRNGLISRRWILSPAFGTIDLLLNTTRERGGLYASCSNFKVLPY